MFKKFGSIAGTILGFVLLGYTASRSYDFIAMTLPADKQILAWFGLAALDGGLLAWLAVYLWGAKGWQRPVALVMVVVDLVGVVVMFTMDTQFQAGQNGLVNKLTTDQTQTAIWALSGIIALNIGATIASHLLSPEALREQAEEEARDKIETATLKKISENADLLAAELSPILGGNWANQTRVKFMSEAGSVPVEVERPLSSK